MQESLYFLIEGGKALDLVRRHIKEMNDAHARAQKLAKEIGVKQFSADKLTGRLTGVVFERDQEPHPDFLKADRNGVCFPRKKSDWFNRIQAVKGHPITSELISEALGVPLTLRWKNGFLHLGYPFRQAGFLFLGKDGPYAMYIPDVAGAIKKAGHGLPDEPARSFKPEFEGCKRILRQEWELIVAQHDAAQARRAEDQRLAKEAGKEAAKKAAAAKAAKVTKTTPRVAKKSFAFA